MHTPLDEGAEFEGQTEVQIHRNHGQQAPVASSRECGEQSVQSARTQSGIGREYCVSLDPGRMDLPGRSD